MPVSARQFLSGACTALSELVSVHVSATDPSRTPSGKPRPALSALLPVGRQRDTHRSTDDDSRYRFASYELSKPEHSRRGRPSSPCPAVAGAKPRDDGLRVASRLPPRSRLGTVTKRARASPAGRRSLTGTAFGRVSPLSSTRATSRRVSFASVARHHKRPRPPSRRSRFGRAPPRVTALPSGTRNHTRTAVGRAPRPQRSWSRDRPRRRPAPGRTGARKHASRDARPRASRAAVVVKPRSLVDPASSHMLVSKIKPCMSQCKPH